MLKKLAIIVAAIAAACVSVQAQTCTRDSLKAMIADYFKAVETHDMSALPTAATAGFINFNQSLPDVHIFKYNADGKIYLINAVFGGRQAGLIRLDEKK